MTTQIQALQAEIRRINEANGWYEDDRTFGDDIALLHSEASEALDAYRSHGYDDATPLVASGPDQMAGRPPKPEGVGSELADVFIRLLDTCERRGIDLEREVARKLRYNRMRGYRHGGKRL